MVDNNANMINNSHYKDILKSFLDSQQKLQKNIFNNIYP